MSKLIEQIIGKVVIVTAMLFLASCSRPSPELCVYGDDFGDIDSAVEIISSSSKYSSNHGWKKTKIRAHLGNLLNITASGHIDLCYGNEEGTNTVVVDGRTSGWTNSGVSLKAGQVFKVTAGHKYTRWPGTHGGSPNCGGGATSNCWIVNGAGAYGVVAGAGFNTSYGYKTDNFSIQNGYGPQRNNTQGNLYLWHYDSSSGVYGDNQGGYHFTIEKISCRGEDGDMLEVYIGDEKPTSSTPATISMHNQVRNGVNGVYNNGSPATGTVWIRIKDDFNRDWNNDGNPDGKGDGVVSSSSNQGNYAVNIIAAQPANGPIGGLINSIVDPLKEFLFGPMVAGVRSGGIIESAFKTVTADGRFIAAVNAAMILAIVLFALSYMVGLSRITQKDLLHFVIKLAIVAVLISPGAWEFFRKFLFTFFIEGVDDMIVILSSQFTTAIAGTVDQQLQSGVGGNQTVVAPGVGASGTFGFLDQTLTRFFSRETNIKIAGLVFSSGIGFIYALIIYYSIFLFILVVAKAIIFYLISIMMIAVLLFTAPLFITFILFDRTRTFFDGWLRQLVNYMMQPVIMFMVVAIFNVFVYSAFYTILSYTVCWQCVVEVDWSIIKFCLFENFVNWGYGPDQTTDSVASRLPVGLFMILMLIIFINLLERVIDWSGKMASSLFNAKGGQDLTGALNTAVAQAVASTRVGSTALTGAAGAAGKVLQKSGANNAARQAIASRRERINNKKAEKKKLKAEKPKTRMQKVGSGIGKALGAGARLAGLKSTKGAAGDGIKSGVKKAPGRISKMLDDIEKKGDQ